MCPKCITDALDSLVMDTEMLAANDESISRMWKPVWKMSQILHLFPNLIPERIVLKKEKAWIKKQTVQWKLAILLVGNFARKYIFRHSYTNHAISTTQLRKQIKELHSDVVSSSSFLFTLMLDYFLSHLTHLKNQFKWTSDLGVGSQPLSRCYWTPALSARAILANHEGW